ncbi:MAG: hypothetical protein LN411_04885 [Candidatus Thermoplasmatota archaeon]|nr:hypothetical protein [Candidatus Thermoplasmatota archaeon]
MTVEENRVTCEIVLRFPSSDSAGKVFHAVEQDNSGYVDAKQEDDSIVAVINASTLKSLLHTLDDFLSCVSVAEKIVSKK